MGKVGNGDVYYHPDSIWDAELVYGIQLHRILFVGNPDQKTLKLAIETGVEVRQSSPTRFNNLPKGCTVFRHAGGWNLAISMMGATREATQEDERQQYIIDDNDPIIHLIDRFSSLWEEGNKVSGVAKFAVGSPVEIVSDQQIGQVEKVQLVSGQALYSVLTQNGLVQVREADLGSLKSVLKDPSSWLSGPLAKSEDLALTITATKLRDPLTDVIYSFQTSRTLFRPYQFKPVMKMLMSSGQRLLIADEVGLGKTIEAGLIWSELDLRSRMDNVLVVAPSALKKKWQDEMYRRFDRKLEDLTNARLDDWLTSIEKGKFEPLKAIASLEGLRSSEHLERFSKLAPRFDLVIVDEAHYLRNNLTQSYAMGEILTDIADAVLFLSATPLNLGNDDLFNLLHLLDSSQFFDRDVFREQIEPNTHLNNVARAMLSNSKSPQVLLETLAPIHETTLGQVISERSDFKSLELILSKKTLSEIDISRAKRHIAELNSLASVFTRTRKAETHMERAIRTPISVHVEWNQDEQAAYDFVRAWFFQRAARKGHQPGLSLQMPLRQAASCLPALFELLEEKYGFSSKDVEDFDDALASTDVDAEETITDYADLLEIPTIKQDTKYIEFERALLEARRNGTAHQVLIFSFFSRTIKYLARELRKTGLRVGIMYGATNAKDRQNLMVDFRKGDYDVLVCSEVASEGLDFEFCDTLVNYDLPWNPMKVEQRIGRLDRFGQKAEKIHILNMQVPGTIEDDIFMRLYQRIGVFENSIGELEPILRDELSSLSELALNPNLTAAQLLAEEERIRVVAENKKSDLVALKDHENLIGGVDAFLIEGFDEHTPGRGRFLGQEEIVRVVDRYFKKKGGAITFEGDSRWSFKGSQQISNEIRQLATDSVYLAKNGNSSMSPANLARQLDGSGEPFIATYSPEIAADFGLELISVKHPLLECVKRDLIESETLLNRFGMVAIPGLSKGSEYLVSIHLARSHGLRPKLELWSTAINLQTLKVEDGPGDKLLQSFASNAFSQPKSTPDLSNIEQALEILELRVAERQLLETDVLISDNRQIRLERDAAKVIGLKNKIASSEKTLNLVTAHNRAISIIRIHQSRLDRLNTELQETESGSSYRNPSLLIEAVALAVVVGR